MQNGASLDCSGSARTSNHRLMPVTKFEQKISDERCLRVPDSLGRSGLILDSDRAGKVLSPITSDGSRFAHRSYCGRAPLVPQWEKVGHKGLEPGNISAPPGV